MSPLIPDLTFIPPEDIVTPCQQDPDTWASEHLTHAAKAGCQPCLVRTRCLTAAFEQREPWGVWGGMSAAERDEIRKAERDTCKRGHRWSPDNTRIDTRGHRVCIACERLRTQKARDRRAA